MAIRTISLFKDTSLSAGDATTSNIIDLRDDNPDNFSVSSKIAAGTSTTGGTTVFTYQCSPLVDGTFNTPSTAAAVGTSGPTLGQYFSAFNPVLTPFMKIVATQTGAGTKGANSKIDAELHVQ